MPVTVRIGAVFLGLGIAGDLGFHLTHGIRPHSHRPGVFDVATVIHLTVAFGMALCLAGVVLAGFKSIQSTHSRRYER